MANTVQIKRGSNSSVNAHTGPSGEIIYNIDTGRLHAQDGATAGGIPHALVSDVDLKANTATQVIAGAGLTGGGDLSASRTVNVGEGTGISVAADAVSLNAASISSLAKADTALQAPGGTTGQILAKNSATTNDVVWVSSEAATAVSYGPQTLTDAQQSQARQNIQADHAYDTIAIATAATVPAYANAIRTNGYYAAGDGGAALYKRVASEPSHAGKVQSADGAWWEIAPGNVSYPTVVGLDQVRVPNGVDAVMMDGYSIQGDGNGGVYSRVGPTPILGPSPVVNGGFSAATGWSIIGPATIGGGVCSFDGPAQASIRQTIPLVAGAKYQFRFSIVQAFTGNGIAVRIRNSGGASAISDFFTEVGTHTVILTAPAGADEIFISNGTDAGVGVIDGVFVQKLHPWQVQDASGDWWERAKGQPLYPVQTLYVPGDFADMPDAFAWLRGRPLPDGVLMNMMLQTGYQITKGVAFNYDDFSQIEIRSTDAQVNVASSFVGVNITPDPFEVNSLFVASNSKAPRLVCLINMGTYGGCGYVLTMNSEGFVSGNCGVINAGAFGLYVNTESKCIATNANFSLAGWGNRVTVNSFLSAPQCNFSQARSATYLTSNNTANLDVSRGSLVYITGTDAVKTNLQGGKGHGLAVRRSFVSATHVDCSQNERIGLNAGAGSVVAFTGSRVSSCLQHGIACDGARIDANSTTIINNGSHNLYADSGGEITARNVTCGGAGANSVRAANGSRINVSGGTCRRGAGDATDDIVVTEGSIIHAYNATGGTNITVRTLNAAGLIFK